MVIAMRMSRRGLLRAAGGVAAGLIGPTALRAQQASEETAKEIVA